jgi:hypothetical protein
VAAALLALAAPALAQQQPQEQPSASDARLNELRRRLLDEGGPQGEQAAADLFTLGVYGPNAGLGAEGSQDPFLREVMQKRDVYKAEARRCILSGLRMVGRFRAEAACRIVQDGFDDPQAQYAQLAVAAIPTLDDEKGTVYRYVGDQLLVLRRARPNTLGNKQALSLIDGLERMPNPIESVGVLVATLKEGRLSRSLEIRVREALQRMTAQVFDSSADWDRWFADARKRSLAEWRLDVARRRDERLRRYESEAERYFGKLLAALQGDKDALFRELSSALNDADTVFAVRRAAIRELGGLGKNGEERAVALLRGRLSQGQSTDYDETKALVIEALGATGNASLLDDVKPFLVQAATYHVRMRMAAAGAIGALKAPGGVDPLLGVLREAAGPIPPPDELLEVVVDSLGQIGANPDCKVSTALLDFVTALRRSGNGGPASTAALLGIVAKSLGALRYPADAEAQRVGGLLEELAAHDDANVRFFATTALGQVPYAKAFPALVERFRLEPAPHVKKSILDAIGQQALDHPDTLVQPAIKLLVGVLDQSNGGDETLARKARQRLEELATKPPGFKDNFVGLEMLEEALCDPQAGAGKPPSAAVPFLSGDNGLPAPDALNPVQQQSRDRYFKLLEVRARGELDVDPASALADFGAIIRGKDYASPSTPEARKLLVGKARALLKVTPPQPKDALQTAASVVSRYEASEDASEGWSVVLEAAEKLKPTGPAAVAAALQPLQPAIAAAPQDVQRRCAELLGTPR